MTETKTIELTNGLIATVDSADYEWLNQYNWYPDTRRQSQTCYAKAVITIAPCVQQRVKMHRMILNAKPGQRVDHIDGNGLNNTRANLRFVTQQQNSWNRSAQRNSSSPYKGVSWHKQSRRWRAKINVSGKYISLGCYATPEEAARAYDEAAIELHGEFARLNF